MHAGQVVTTGNVGDFGELSSVVVGIEIEMRHEEYGRWQRRMGRRCIRLEKKKEDMVDEFRFMV